MAFYFASSRFTQLPLSCALALTMAGCTVSNHAEVKAPSIVTHNDAYGADWQAQFAEPGPITVESALSGRFDVAHSGLLNFEDEKVIAAGIEDGPFTADLPVHMLKHPEFGIYIVDSGVSQDFADGGGGQMGVLVQAFLKSVEVEEPLGQMLKRQDQTLAGVLITHMHLDHVIGLPDVPLDVPIYAGPGEFQAKSVQYSLLRRSFRGLFRDRIPLQTWNFEEGQSLGPIESAIDVLGDGSLWALNTPGHTPGSTSYLVNSTEGPVLFVGDTSHTYWGWENGVEPGTYTSDHEANRKSLHALKELADLLPGTRVHMGHDSKIAVSGQ